MKPTFFVISVLIGFNFLTITGCSGGGSTADPAAAPITNDNTGFDSAEFFVGVGNSDKITSHTRTDASFSTSCSIPANTTSEDMTCIIDVPEADLHYHGLEISYNVPESMCRYLSRETYWFYNQEVGYGPTAVRINKTVNDAGDVLSFQCSVNGGAVGACSGLTEIDVDSSDSTVTCKYDRTQIELANCCFGEYTLTQQTTNTDTAEVSTETSENKWGGDWKSCIGGAGKTNWSWFSRSNFPVSVVEDAEDGLAEEYKITSPLNATTDTWNLSTANYYTPATHTHDGYIDARSTNLPYFIDPVDDRDGTLIPVANPAYTFSCLDESYEIQNRISVYVREWDVYTDYLAYIASAGVTSDPDRPGETEPADCDGVDGNCNDKWDLDDFINEYLTGPYETATAALRRLNFPEQIYE